MPQLDERRRHVVQWPPRGTRRPSRRYSVPNLASQMRVAFASMAWNTGSSSPGELDDDLAAPRRSRSAAPATRAARRCAACTSSNSRTFSIAITAWSAKVVTSSICLSVNGCTVVARSTKITPIGVPSRSSGTPSMRAEAADLLRASDSRIPDRPEHRERERPCLRARHAPTTRAASGLESDAARHSP